jgi:phospholipid/cholesterol/gamma-HCH transport system substrate-binding protein
MKQFTPELKVGILTLVALIVLATGTLFVGKFQWFKQTYEMNIQFDFVSGLQEGAPVRLNGVKVGAVRKISIDTKKTPPIIVTVQLDKKALMHKDAKAFINTLGLMGEKYVEIYAGSSNQPFLAYGDSIVGESPTEVSDILQASKQVANDLARTMSVIADVFSQESTRISLKNVIARIDSISTNLDETITNRRGDVEDFARNLRILSENMNKTILEVNAILQDNKQDTRALVANLTAVSLEMKNHSQSIMENLDKLSGQLNETATQGKPELQTTLKNFREASEDFKSTMKRLDNLAGKVEKGEGTVGKIMTDETLYGQTTETVSAIRDMALSISSSGKALSNTQFEYEMRYRDSVDRMRNDIHLRISPNNKKYYLVGASDIGKDVGLDLIYARREGPFDIKLGVLESEAAAGIDYHIKDKDWTIGITGVGLTEKKPRLDVQTQFKVGHYFDVDWYGIVGGENLTRDATANAGIQIRY